MPSQSFNTFRSKNLEDVKRLLEAHASLTGPGRNALDHLTRGAILFLAASWEVYLEDVINESARFIVNNLNNPQLLPVVTQQRLSRFVKNYKDHELKPLELAGNGWRSVYLEMVSNEVNNVNTPKSTVIGPLLREMLGIAQISEVWTDVQGVDDFVSYRGEIAHRVRPDYYVKVAEVLGYVDLLFEQARITDNYLSDYLKTSLALANRPWNRIT